MIRQEIIIEPQQVKKNVGKNKVKKEKEGVERRERMLKRRMAFKIWISNKMEIKLNRSMLNYFID